MGAMGGREVTCWYCSMSLVNSRFLSMVMLMGMCTRPLEPSWALGDQDWAKLKLAWKLVELFELTRAFGSLRAVGACPSFRAFPHFPVRPSFQTRPSFRAQFDNVEQQLLQVVIFFVKYHVYFVYFETELRPRVLAFKAFELSSLPELLRLPEL